MKIEFYRTFVEPQIVVTLSRTNLRSLLAMLDENANGHDHMLQRDYLIVIPEEDVDHYQNRERGKMSDAIEAALRGDSS